jgi:hypothetical protein
MCDELEKIRAHGEVLLKYSLVKTERERALGTQLRSFLDFVNLTFSVTCVTKSIWKNDLE